MSAERHLQQVTERLPLVASLEEHALRGGRSSWQMLFERKFLTLEELSKVLLFFVFGNKELNLKILKLWVFFFFLEEFWTICTQIL